MHRYKELDVWKKSMKLGKAVYQLTSRFPNEEKYGLTSQMRRSAISVASNIAEGAGRSSNKEFSHILSISTGSLFEIETQILLAKDLGFISANIESILEEIAGIANMLYGLKKTLN